LTVEIHGDVERADDVRVGHWTGVMRRAPAIFGSAIFLVIAPGTLAVYMPWYFTQWHFEPALFPIARVIGGILIAAGLPILLDSFARFALQGLGTPAPVAPPKQGLLFGSVAVLGYGAMLWATFFLFVLGYEEPALGEQFPEQYKRYRANVRRWIPRTTPWRGDS
jgi:hypothetical protein